MRKIDVRNYDVMVMGTAGKTAVPYDLKGSMMAVMFHPELRLSARELLLRNQIALKIESASDFVMLEEAEYDKIKDAFERFVGFSQNDIEMVQRVFDADEIEVQEVQ